MKMKPVFIDVREPSEFSRGHVEGAINIPPAVLMRGEPEELKKLERNTPLVVYCLSGSRSNASIPFIRSFGFTDITNGINKEQVAQRYL
jgi:rhodanese-related sulfurtransferase